MFACLVVAGCAPTGHPPDPRNVVLITMDTTRADHLGCYGHEAIRTPNIDALAGRSVRFDRCYSAIPITLPSHTTILTGLYPIRHSVRDNGTFSVPDDVPTLATILRDHGWRTIGVIGSFPLTRPFGLARGFDVWNEDFQSRRHQVMPMAFDQRQADHVTRTALRLVKDNRDGPFFLFAHYFDPHRPWEAPALYAKQYRSSPYDAEIAFTDAWIGQLLDGLRDMGLADNTIVILTADHGEGFSDHEEETHSFLLYDGTIRVPLLLSGPGIDPGVVERPVSSADITPTILQLLGIRTDEVFDGVSLLTPPPGDRLIYSESLAGRLQHGWNDMRSAVVGNRKLILGPQSELYDVRSDLAETDDLHQAEPEVAERLESRLRQFIASVHPRHTLEERFSVAPDEVRASLEALGYVVAADVDRDWSELGPITVANDPRRHIDLVEVQSVARSLMNEGQIPLMLEIVGAALEREPDDAELLRLEVAARVGGGQGQMAVAYADRLAALVDPTARDLKLFALARRAAGDLEGALVFVRRAREIEDDPTARTAEMELLSRLDRHAEAQTLIEETLRNDPCDDETLRFKAIDRRQSGDLDGMEAAYRQMLTCDPHDVQAHYNIGNVRLERGDIDGAEAAFHEAERIDPSYGGASFGLALVALERDRTDAAAELLERTIAIEPVNSAVGRRAAELLTTLETDDAG